MSFVSTALLLLLPGCLAQPLPADDECQADGECSLSMLQLAGSKNASDEGSAARALGESASHAADWVRLIEGSDCPSGGAISCDAGRASFLF